MDLKTLFARSIPTVASSDIKGSSDGDNNILDYGVVHWREQEPSIPSIEQLFAKIKHGFRTAAQRSFNTVSDALKHVLHTVTKTECANYPVNAGYASS